MVRKYEKSDFETIDSWFEAQRPGCHLEREAIPSIGFIAEDCACGFLYQTDSNMAIVELFIANPKKSKETRDLALMMVLDALITASAELKFKRVFGFSTSHTMVKRALALGFDLQENAMTVVLENK